MSSRIQHSSAQHLILCTYAWAQQMFLKQMNLDEDAAIPPKKFRLMFHSEDLVLGQLYLPNKIKQSPFCGF